MMEGNSQPSKVELNIDDLIERFELGPFHYRLLFICGLTFMVY
jgi:hypothetical protein